MLGAAETKHFICSTKNPIFLKKLFFTSKLYVFDSGRDRELLKTKLDSYYLYYSCMILISDDVVLM